MTKIFIDGSAGTTGLRIHQRLSELKDIQLLTLSEELRKNDDARKKMINASDVTFLCLPDDASRQAMTLLDNDKTKIIDTSTAHRVADGWVYGFPELNGYRQKIKNSRFIANPGCHASGFIALVNPLTQNGLIDKSSLLTCFSVTGYTGGGKSMIKDYSENPQKLSAPRQYGLTQTHKHIPEIIKVCDLSARPCFCPIVGNFPCGMQVTVPLNKKDLKCSVKELKDFYKSIYNGKVVYYNDSPSENGFTSASALAGKDSMEISVLGSEEWILLVSRFDNLGKGASGSAIQNMNIILDREETNGLVL